MRIYDYADVIAFKTAAVITAAASAAVAREADWATEWFGAPLPVLLMAFAGAALALSLLPKTSTKQWAVAVALGTAIGVFLPQIVIAIYPSLKPALTAAAFFAGLVGKLAATMIFEDGRALIIGWIKSRFGGAS